MAEYGVAPTVTGDLDGDGDVDFDDIGGFVSVVSGGSLLVMEVGMVRL